MSLKAQVEKQSKAAKQASYQLLALSPEQKNIILLSMAHALLANSEHLIAENQKDIDAAHEAGLSDAMIDRLILTPERIQDMADGFETVSQLPDPVGEPLGMYQHPNGLPIEKVCFPIGLIAIIYESRPNVTADVIGLCLKSGNSVILKGGSEAIHSNRAIFNCLNEAGFKAGMPDHAIEFIDATDRQVVEHLVTQNGVVDLVIPRGGEGLIRAVSGMATIPVLKHDKGLCHVFVDESADVEMAINIVENAKCQRPGVCNALETLLVHEAIAAELLPKLATKIAAVELRTDEQAAQYVPNAKPATPADWDTEYLDLVLAIKVVPDADAAIAHINEHGSHHSDAIITQDQINADRFCWLVDSSSVYVNASTRFTDGSEFGMGAEMGISTDKLHARGPVGLQELTTYKYLIKGSGQIRG